MSINNLKAFGPIASVALPAYVAYRASTAKNNRVAKVLASIPCCYAIHKMGPLMERTPSAIPAVAISSLFAASVLSNQNNLLEIAAAGLMAPTLATGGSLIANRIIEAAPNSLLSSILSVFLDIPSALRNLFTLKTEGPLALIKIALAAKV